MIPGLLSKNLNTELTVCSKTFFFTVMLSEVLQVVWGAGRVGAAFATTQAEQLRLIACNSTLGAGIKAAQDAVGAWSGTMIKEDKVI